MGPTFAHWISRLPELGCIPYPLPSFDWLWDLSQLVKYHFGIALAHDRKVFSQKAKVAMHIDDVHMGSQRAFAQVRGAPRSPVHQVVRPLQCQAQATWHSECNQVTVTNPGLDSFQVSTPVTVGDLVGAIVARSDGKLTLQLPSLSCELASEVTVSQQCLVVEPSEVATELTAYWGPLWHSDSLPPDSDHDALVAVLGRLPPQEPVIVNLTLEELKLAIRRLRAGSARGVDGISAAELKVLPDGLLKLLLRIFQNQVDGFPADLMKARTFPLNKIQGVPCGSQTRPITVLSQLYRLWGNLVCHQILALWAHRMPPQITGLLPHRGAHQAAYGAQAMLEMDGKNGQSPSGVTLDLRKCFNMIRHVAAKKLLLALRLPCTIVSQWFASISAISRFWEIDGNLFGPHACHCGLPEGDIFSVLVMIGIAFAWTVSVSQAANQQAVCWAYADNWAWKSFVPDLHAPIFQVTEQTVLAFGLQIDYPKTWYWAVDSTTAHCVLQVLNSWKLGHGIHRKHHARDLGYEMHYSGSNRLGHRKDRHLEGHARLKRLGSLPSDVLVKEHILSASIWPATFHGCEIYPPAQETLASFRTAAADALVGYSHASNPAILLLLGDKKILDPGFYCLTVAIRQARTWLLAQPESIQNRFLTTVARHSGSAHAVKGPASALKVYLSRVNWVIDSKGNIMVTPFLSCNLISDSFQRLIRFATQAWQEDLLTLYSSSKKLRGLPDISRVDTTAILRSFPKTDRRTLLREISGAFLTGDQKAHCSSVEPLCTHCHLLDSCEHRLLHCPAFDDIRAVYQPTLTRLVDEGSSQTFFPVIHVHPNQMAHQALHCQETVFDLCPRAIALAEHKLAIGVLPQFFTDGSCLYPQYPSSRFAAAAVIMDLCDDDNQRILEANKFVQSGIYPATLQCVAQGRTPCEQNINRAELSAIIAICKHVAAATIVTDSFYSLSKARALQTGRKSVIMEDNADLLVLLQKNITEHHVFQKIKSHVNLQEIENPLQLYAALGNQVANDAAIAACKSLLPDFVSSLRAKHHDIQSQRSDLKQVFRLHLELHRARQNSERQKDMCEEPPIQTNLAKSPLQIQALLSEWVPAAPLSYDTVFVPPAVLDKFLFGPAWAHEFASWLQELKWDGMGRGPTERDIGVTWFELGLSFSMHSQLTLPIIRRNADGETRILFPTSSEDAIGYQYSANDVATTMFQFWTAFHSLSFGQPPLSLTKGAQYSLVLLGHKSQSSGIRPRPWFPCGQSVVALTSKLLFGRSSYQCDLTPTWCTRSLAVGSVSFEEAKKTLKLGQLQTRRLRRAVGDA